MAFSESEVRKNMSKNIGHLGATVSMNIDPFQRSARTLEAQQRALKASMKATDAMFSGSGKSIQSLGLKYKLVSAQMKSQQEIVSRLKKSYEEKALALKSNHQATEKEIQDVAKAERKYMSAEAELSKMSHSLKGLENDLRRQGSVLIQSGAKIEAFGKKVNSIGTTVEGIGKKMSFFSVPIGVGLFAATKSAVTFSSELQKMSALLDDGTVSGDKLKQQLSGLGDASKKWSVQYGISTTAINDGMEEIIKKGYTYEQTLGAMPSIMDASVASGEDFNVVMNNSTSILEQFGLKVADTQGTLKNTQRVTDSLTFVANKTAAGFADMGLAMEYVGPVAHSAEISLEQTSAAIGLMSNNGIEGEKAGTALRGALTRLLKPSKQNIEGFTKLGISSKAFRDGTLDLPTLLDKIKNNTKGWTGAQRASAIALAFGTEAQTGMNVLVNQGGDALRNLTDETKNATGNTKDLAEKMGNTAAKKVERFKQSVHVLGIEFGDKVLPAITPIIEEGTELIQKFSEMDDQTQQTIVKWALIAAAAGPVTYGIGAITRGAGSLINLGGTLTKGLGNILLQSKNVQTGMTAVSAGTKVATAGMGAATEGASLFGLALSPVGLGVLGVGAALVGGYAAWKIWGEKAYEAADSASKWGSDVGEDANKALGDFKKFSDESSMALDTFSSKVEGNAKKIGKATDDMVKDISKAGDQTVKKQKELLKDMPDNVKEAGEKAVKATEKENKKRMELAGTAATQIKNILKQHNNDRSKLSKDEYRMVSESQRELANLEVNALEISGSKKKNVLAALNNDYQNMSAKQRQTTFYDIQESVDKELSLYDERKKKIQASDKFTAAEKKAMLKELKSTSDTTTSEMLKAQIKIAKSMGKNSNGYLKEVKNYCKDAGISYRSLITEMDKDAQKMAGSNDMIAKSTGKMSDKTVEANQRWNALVFDEKTGKVKTNAAEEVANAMKSKKGWESMEFVIKHANLSTNAKATMLSAIIQNGKWGDLTFEEKQLLVGYKGSANVMKALNDMGKWQSLTPKQQQLLAKAKTADEVIKALKDMGLWKSYPSPEKKKLLADSTDITNKVQAGIDVIVGYNNTKVSLKNLLASNSNLVNRIKQGQNVIVNYNGKKVNLKTLFGDNSDLLTEFASGKNTITDFNNNYNPLKKFLEVATNAGDSVGPINDVANSWSKVPYKDKKTLTIQSVLDTPGLAAHKAVGTNNFQGGPAILGDGAKREPFLTPSGFLGISPNTDTPVTLPKGTRIWSSVARFNQHQSLTGSRFVQSVARLKTKIEDSKSGLATLLKPNVIMNNDTSHQEHQIQALEKSNQQQDQMIDLLLQLVNKGSAIDLKSLERNQNRIAAERAIREQYGLGG